MIVSIVVTTAGVMGGCGRAKSAHVPVRSDAAHNVSIWKVGKSTVVETYDATGTVSAKTTTQVSANLLGRIDAITVNEGDTVNKGQLLFEIDDRDANTQLEKAKAGLKEAQASFIELDNSIVAASAAVKTAEAGKQLADVTFARYDELFKRRSVSGQEYDEALSRANAAAAELERAKADVRTIGSKKSQINARIEQAMADIANSRVQKSYTRIVSPVSGVIVKKFVESGAIASPGVPLLSIEDSSLYRLEAVVGESHSNLVHIGDRVKVTVDALGTDEIVGTVSEMLPTSDPASRSYTVKIDLPANPLLRTGLYGLARFSSAQKQVIAVPETAIVRRGQLTGVYMVGSDGAVRFRIIAVGKTSDGMIEILSGLEEGSEVASSDVAKLNDGTKVR